MLNHDVSHCNSQSFSFAYELFFLPAAARSLLSLRQTLRRTICETGPLLNAESAAVRIFSDYLGDFWLEARQAGRPPLRRRSALSPLAPHLLRPPRNETNLHREIEIILLSDQIKL